MKTITLTDETAKMLETFADSEYTSRVKADICDAFCALIAEADQNKAEPPMNVLVMLQEYADLITAISESETTDKE